VSYYCFTDHLFPPSSSSSRTTNRGNGINQVSKALIEAAEEEKKMKKDVFLEGIQFPPEQVTCSCAVMVQAELCESNKNHQRKRVGWKAHSPGCPFYFEHVREIAADHV
jgi:hypothetical protein